MTLLKYIIRVMQVEIIFLFFFLYPLTIYNQEVTGKNRG